MGELGLDPALGHLEASSLPLPLGQFINLYKEEEERVMSAQLPVGYAFTIGVGAGVGFSGAPSAGAASH